MSLHELRKLLPAANLYHFFNYAATAPMLKPCADTMMAIIQEGLEPLSFHFEKWMAILESARRSVAATINTSPEEIAFTTSTSSALSLIARSIAWNPGDRVLYPANDFPSNRYIWESLGVRGEAIESEDFVQTVLNLDLGDVKLVALSAVSYIDGTVFDIAKLVRHCHAKGILVAVDAIQAVGAIPVNVKEWQCDFLACGGQKWLLGPVGSAFFYIHRKHLHQLNVPLIGWASSKDAGDFDNQKFEFVDGARRFEPGLPDIAAIAGLGKNLDVFSAIGWDKIFHQIQNRTTYLRNAFLRAGYEIANFGANQHSGILTLNFKTEEEARKLYQKCLNDKIILTQRKTQLRISCHATVGDSDLEKLLSIFGIRGSQSPEIVLPETSCTKGSGFKWKHALVTGGNQGLGAALALSLAKRGCNLTLLGRDEGKLRKVAEGIRKQYGVVVKEELSDLSQPAFVEAWLRQAHDSDIDLVINNAAWAEAGCFMDTNLSDYRKAMETNFFSSLLISQHFLPKMINNQKGAIVNIVTSGARCALPLFSAYASSKAALWAWSEALSRELEGTGVQVTTFVPSKMSTNTSRRLGRKALSYYHGQIQEVTPPTDLNKIAEQVIDSLIKQKRYTAPLSVKFKIALNSLFHHYATKKILRFWSYVSSSKR